MANEEQLAILKQGVEVWNRWRKKNPDVKIDLSEADLSEADLKKADLHEANLTDAGFSDADLTQANLRKANLSKASLHLTNLSYAHLTGTNLSNAYLTDTNFSHADLMDADLSDANCSDTIFKQADLRGANFRSAAIWGVTFTFLDLSQTKGLEGANHYAPSAIDTDTLQQSKGKIPEIFLRGCGLSDWEIQMAKLYNPDLSNNELIDIQNKIFTLRQRQAIQISSLFISYSHGDSTFVDKLESQLNNKGIRFWRDIHDMKAGRIETQIDRAISQNRTVLLVLSKNSIKSDWVEHEVRTARGLEKEVGRDVLCPVALDDSWRSSPWPRRVMEQIMEYNILDFSSWEDDVKFEEMFRKLIDGLELFYKDKSHGE